MKILILGGTRFLGPALVKSALENGHELTLFNRGKSNPNLFPNLEKLRGDRDNDLKALANRTWDSVIDTSGYVPRHVQLSAQLLKDAVRQYVFISTVSVYANFGKPGIGEDRPVGTIEDETNEEITAETYGPLKALCEQAAEAAMPGQVTVIRPGLIVGPGDTSDRFTYWPVRISRGGEVLAPELAEAPVQYIDVRDLARWTIRMVEQGHAGVYNATGPQSPLSMAEFLYGCRAVTSGDIRFTWIDQDFLVKQELVPYLQLPLWVPRDEEYAGFGTVKNDRAVGLGLRFRPLADTARDTLQWHATRPLEYEWRAGLTPERETELLAVWHGR